MSDLPKFRKAVMIRFSSLRDGIGSNMGVIPDIDTWVERECYRVKTGEGWKWKIKGFNQIPWWDYGLAETDQICLDEIGSDSDFFEIL